MAYYDNFTREQLLDIVKLMESTDNIIETENEEVIGFFGDIKRYYKDTIDDALKLDQYDEAQDFINELKEIEDYKDYTGLLILSHNNGMGLTCEPYKLVEEK